MRSRAIVRGCSVMAQLGRSSPCDPRSSTWLGRPRRTLVMGSTTTSVVMISRYAREATTRTGRLPDWSRPRVGLRSAHATEPRHSDTTEPALTSAITNPPGRRRGLHRPMRPTQLSPRGRTQWPCQTRWPWSGGSPRIAVPAATPREGPRPVSYTHLRAHETRHDLVCRLLLEKKKKKKNKQNYKTYTKKK